MICKKGDIYMYNVKRAFSLLEKISFERIGGSSEETRAAEIIKQEIERVMAKVGSNQ